MEKGKSLVSLLVLGWIWTLHGLPVLPEPLYPTQENFDLGRLMGKWYELAVVSTCPHYMQRQGRDPVIGTVELQNSAGNGTVKMTGSVLKHGICKHTSADYGLTSTPGRFFYHVAKFGADVDSYVVRSDYEGYAILIVLSTDAASGERSIIVKLLSRAMDVRPTVFEDFKTLVREQGMREDSIIIKQNKGECTPGELAAAPPAQRQRAKRTVEPFVHPAEVDMSGDDTRLFRRGESCNAAPDAGPCFGTLPRYFYNSSSMSCQLFTYGGCLGNQNNFDSERDCLQSCRTEAVCRLPMVAHPCTNQPLVWTFDSVTGLCLGYKQGFCQANGNRFYSKAECEEYCGVVKDDEELLKTN
ncbi:protein AMBP-like [Lampris incognitus]|uniref:protein AMBP-like n=1 Tax=Lampris incognitus TaxID=2546036 RepID=UPI0024B586CC|nr:protein AMBP-like [Lampris incognitus]